MTTPDARYRPFRAAAYGTYIVMVVAFCLAIIVSVARSVQAMSPALPASAETVLTYRECLDAASTLWGDLESGREKLVRPSPTSTADAQWMAFRTTWLRRLREEESRCALGSRGHVPLRNVYRRLEDVMDHYTVHAVQYAGEVGGAVDALQGAFTTARKDPAAGTLP